MNKLLVIKHWQLWILVFLIPIIIANSSDLFKEISILYFGNAEVVKVFSIISQFIALGFLFYWIWTLGVNLYLKANDKLNHNIKWFKVAFCAILISCLLIGLTRFISFHYFDYGFIVMVIMFSLLLIFVYSYLYCIHFVTKLINAIESGNLNTSINQYNKDYVLLFLFPIGIWFMQPRINLIFKDK